MRHPPVLLDQRAPSSGLQQGPREAAVLPMLGNERLPTGEKTPGCS